MEINHSYVQPRDGTKRRLLSELNNQSYNSFAPTLLAIGPIALDSNRRNDACRTLTENAKRAVARTTEFHGVTGPDTRGFESLILLKAWQACDLPIPTAISVFRVLCKRTADPFMLTWLENMVTAQCEILAFIEFVMAFGEPSESSGDGKTLIVFDQ